MNKRLFKSLLVLTPVATIGAFTPITACTKKAKTFQLNINAPEGVNVEFSKTEGEVGKDFWSYITCDKKIDGVIISVNTITLSKDAFMFDSLTEPNMYFLWIKGQYITSDNISIKIISSEPVVETVTVTFDAGEGMIDGQHSVTKTFDKNLTWAEIEKPNDPVLAGNSFLHWSLTDGGVEVPDDHIFAEGDKVYAVYHTHEFNLLTAENDKLYWTCECGEKKALTDEELSVYADKFLVDNDGILEESDTTNLQEIQAQYPGKKTLDIYIVSGDFSLSSSNDNSTLNFHGVLNSQNKCNVTIQCGQVAWHGSNTKLTFTNVFMHGGTSETYLDNGLHCGDLECSNCTFDGYQSIWAINTAKFTNCIFDSTKQDEYTFYTYGSTKTIDFNGCTFDCYSKAIKVFREIDAPLTITFTKTTFNIDPAGKDDAKSAIEIDSHACLGCIGPDCQWNIYADQDTIDSIDTNVWDTVCKDRWKDYSQSPPEHYTYNRFVRFNNKPVPGNPPMPEHTHTLGGYQIIDNKIYGVCAEYGDTFELNQDQLGFLKNKVFYRRNGNYGYTLTGTEHTDINDIVLGSIGGSIDVYLINGEYKIGSSWPDGGYNINVNINGISDYEGNRQASFDCINKDAPRTLYKWHGMNLTCKNVKLLGLTIIEQGNDWQLNGLQPQTMFAEDCDVIGCHTMHAVGLAKFKNCHFDNTMLTGEGDLGEEYCIYTYNGLTDFEDCDFVSNGKAIKIYSLELMALKGHPGTFNISNCTFTISDQKVFDKCAIEIDSGLQLETNHYQILIEHCSQTDFAGLYKDKSTKSDITFIE